MIAEATIEMESFLPDIDSCLDLRDVPRLDGTNGSSTRKRT